MKAYFNRTAELSFAEEHLQTLERQGEHYSRTKNISIVFAWFNTPALLGDDLQHSYALAMEMMSIYIKERVADKDLALRACHLVGLYPEETKDNLLPQLNVQSGLSEPRARNRM